MAFDSFIYEQKMLEEQDARAALRSDKTNDQFYHRWTEACASLDDYEIKHRDEVEEYLERLEDEYLFER